MRIFRTCLIGLLLVGIGTSVGRAGLTVERSNDETPRNAVVIGNTDYTEFQPLVAAVRDARLVSEALRQIGFDVVLIANADSTVMRLVTAKLPLLFEPEGIGLFYYSGYGAEVDGANYLLPTDSSPGTKQQLLETAAALKAVSERAQLAGIASQLLILDANRQVPAFGALDGVHATFAPPSAVGDDFFAVLATAPGTTAPPTAGETSPLAAAFAAAVGRTGLDIADIFRIIRMRTRESTGGDQIPWAFSSLAEAFILNPATGSEPTRGALITSCDLLAADPADADRVAPPVGTDTLDVLTALRECERAVLAEPDNPRQLYQFARTVELVGAPADALALYQGAATFGYAAAIARLTELGAR